MFSFLGCLSFPEKEDGTEKVGGFFDFRGKEKRKRKKTSCLRLYVHVVPVQVRGGFNGVKMKERL